MDEKSFSFRMPKKWVRLSLLVLVTALIVAPLTAIASHSFTDVPDSNIFHADIEWLRDAGVTRGCNPPANTQFCPKQAVTREAMAAFMHRFYNNLVPDPTGIGVEKTDSQPITGNGVVVEANLSIPASGVLLVWASADVENTTVPDALACGINAGGATNLAIGDSWRAVDLTASSFETCATQTAFSVTPGNQLVRLVVVEAESSTRTGVEGSSVMTVLITDFGGFSLLEASELERPGPDLSDEPKAGS